jgi:DNA-binding beta-propeller fold protein YncE
MRQRFRTTALNFIGAFALATTISAITATPAFAATSLALPGYGDIAVDEVHQLVFISGGPTANTVLVTNFSGQVTKTIDNEPGAAGLELSADGTKLYTALSAGDGLAVIDTTTLAETARYSTGAQTCPTHLARTGTLIWYGYGCEGTFTGKIGKLDTAATTPAPVGNLQGNARFQRAPLLAATGADTGPLVAGQLALSSSMVQTYAVQAGALTPGVNGDVVGASLTDLDITPDGTTLFSAAGSRDRVDALSPTDLSRRGAYSVRPRPDAVSLNADNTYLATGAITGDNNDVLVYKLGASVPTKTIALSTGDVVAPRGLAWAANQNRLFVISLHDNQPAPSLTVVTAATGT